MVYAKLGLVLHILNKARFIFRSARGRKARVCPYPNVAVKGSKPNAERAAQRAA